MIDISEAVVFEKSDEKNITRKRKDIVENGVAAVEAMLFDFQQWGGVEFI